jgi:hypothetical protein
MITLTREEAQSVLDALSDCREDSEELFYDYKQKYGDHYKPQRITFQQSVLDQSAQAIETLRARLSAPEPSIVEDAIVYGTGITMGGNRIDPASIYKEPEPPCKTGSQCIGGKCPQCVVSEPEPVAVMKTNAIPIANLEDSPLLYPAPPQREWQGLTDEDVYFCTNHINRDVRGWAIDFARAIEAKLREKNT